MHLLVALSELHLKIEINFFIKKKKKKSDNMCINLKIHLLYTFVYLKFYYVSTGIQNSTKFYIKQKYLLSISTTF